jgi:hypothetical protein
MPSIRFHHDAALKRKFVIHATECGNRDEWRKFTITEANALRWMNGHASMFLCKATTISFTGPKRRAQKGCLSQAGYASQGSRNGQIARNNKLWRWLSWTVTQTSSIYVPKGIRLIFTIAAKFSAIRYSNKERKNYAFKHRRNADETVVYFDMPPNYTMIVRMQTKLKLEVKFSHSMFRLRYRLTIIWERNARFG